MHALARTCCVGVTVFIGVYVFKRVCLQVFGWVCFAIVTLLIGLCLTDMESGERLASPAPTLSAARTSSPAASSSSSSSSSPAPHSKSSLAPSPSTLGSTLSTSGKKHFSLSSVSQRPCPQRKKIQANTVSM